ncbi:MULTISPECIES: HAD-IIA family hydrolase [unclassified Mesorhizobium]|uniref:HAD-IIA family hydrolase n=1 Tax=unclassified Mesorhizobium TaxID=325217 RepID=UPI00333A7EEB
MPADRLNAHMMLPRSMPKDTTISGIISDLDGVVYRGDNPIADAVQAFRAWHSNGVPYVFVTNSTTKSSAEFATKLCRMGVPVTEGQVFGAIAATVSLMRRRWPSGATVFAIGERPLFEALEVGGFRRAGEDAEIVVLSFDYALTYAKLRTAVRAALGGAAVVVTNPDILTPAEDGYEPCVGTLMAAMTAAVPGCAPIVVGKPEPFMIEEALALIGTPRSQTIMIGDQVATDILAGQRAGLRSVLVTTGVPAQSVPGVAPDRVVASLLDI